MWESIERRLIQAVGPDFLERQRFVDELAEKERGAVGREHDGWRVFRGEVRAPRDVGDTTLLFVWSKEDQLESRLVFQARIAGLPCRTAHERDGPFVWRHGDGAV